MRKSLVGCLGIAVLASLVVGGGAQADAQRATATPAGATATGAGPTGATERASAFPGANGRIVFSGFPNSTTPYEEIYRVNADGSGLVRLTTNNGDKISDVWPDWAPSGRRFVFQRTRGTGDSDLYIMSAGGTLLDRVTTGNVDDVMPSWAPNDDKIAYVRATADTWGVWVKDLSSGVVTRMTDPPAGVRDLNPEWSPDGNDIVFWRDFGDHSDIVTVAVKTGPFRPGVETTIVGRTGVYNSYPDWAPGGGRIAYSRNSDSEHDTDIFIVQLSTGDVTRVTRNQVNDLMPAWSPSGKKLVWARGPLDAQTPHDLVVRDLGSGTQTTLTGNPRRLDQEPDWGVAP